MGNELEHWKGFWNGKQQPLHGSASPEHYDKYAAELKTLFRSDGYNRILELGCGNGVFYQRLGFDKADYYKGVDLSESMLEEFRKLHPDVALQTASAHDYLDDNKYDLVYSNGVMQHLDQAMLRSHFLNAEQMLSENGEIIDASLPWRIHRKAYRMRQLTPPYSFMNKIAIKSAIAWMMERIKVRKDRMGHWYNPHQIAKTAEEFDLRAEFFGSMNYPYRFHAVMRKT